MVEFKVRQAEAGDVQRIVDLQYAAYPTMSKVAAWRPEHLTNHQAVFPEGQLVAESEGKVVGYCANLITRSEIAFNAHKYAVITGRGSLSTHDANGDTLYGAEIMVHPDMRRNGIARGFYEKRFELCRAKRLKYFVSGGRLPGYAEHKETMTIEQYVASVLRGQIVDRTLSAQTAVGLCVRSILPDYINDPNSGNFATLLAWQNPDLADPTSPPLCPSVVALAPSDLEQALRPSPPAPPAAAW